ncbi:MAG: VCBS repeat-containing protein [Bryobacteraceae bacterium]|jgi:VCBS repeat protein
MARRVRSLFDAPMVYPATKPAAVAVADFNGDGKPDLAVAQHGGSVGILLGDGKGHFGEAVSYPAGGGIMASLAVKDFNGDGKPDLAVTSEYYVAILLGNGDGTFHPL